MIAGIHMAYKHHYPLVLSPDMFWLLILQGLSIHVNQNAEAMRKMFVDFEGKKEIEVRNDELIRGCLESTWEIVFPVFSDKIRGYIGDENHDNIIVVFSTTGHVEKVATQISLMDTMKSYFDYKVCTLCGIPSVQLEGTMYDWERLRDKTEQLSNAYDLSWWTDNIIPILDKIVRNAEGKDDPYLWSNIYKQTGGSGGPFISGWITQFLPYLECTEARMLVSNKYLGKDMSNGWGGLTNYDLPSGISNFPFIWEYYDQKINMEFVAGFAGVTQNKSTKAVRPKIAWAVCEVWGDK